MVNFSLRKVFAAMIDDKDSEIAPEEISYPSESKAHQEEEIESDSENEEEVETLNSERELEVVDDPMSGAFDLEGGDRFESFENDDLRTPWKNKVENPKEFFNSEIVYRFDIIPPEELNLIKGDYRIELSNVESGTWFIKVSDTLEVTNSYADAETVLSMTQRDFMDIVNGVLNPQLALLSKKIDVKGNSEKAMRLQDLLAPRVD